MSSCHPRASARVLCSLAILSTAVVVDPREDSRAHDCVASKQASRYFRGHSGSPRVSSVVLRRTSFVHRPARHGYAVLLYCTILYCTVHGWVKPRQRQAIVRCSTSADRIDKTGRRRERESERERGDVTVKQSRVGDGRRQLPGTPAADEMAPRVLPFPPSPDAPLAFSSTAPARRRCSGVVLCCTATKNRGRERARERGKPPMTSGLILADVHAGPCCIAPCHLCP